jgi:signal transduction histidine kinase
MVDYGDDCLRILVRDDGCGMAGERSGHFGLRGMRERAEAIGASWELSSHPDAGTSVHLTIDAMRAYAGAAGRGLLMRLRRRVRPVAA